MPLRTLYDVCLDFYPDKAERAGTEAAELAAKGFSTYVEGDDLDQDKMWDMIRVLIRKHATYRAKHEGTTPDKELRRFYDLVRLDPSAWGVIYESMAYDYVSLVNFRLAGAKSFEFSDSLTSRLLRTEMNVDSSLIRLPFRTCQFTFAGEMVGEAARMAPEVRIEPDQSVSLMVSVLNHPDKSDKRLFRIAGGIIRGKRDSGNPGFDHKQTDVVTFFHRDLILSPGRTMESSLMTDWGNENFHVGIGEEANFDALKDLFLKHGKNFYRVVLNAALYLSSRAPDIGPERFPRDQIIEAAIGRSSAVRRRAAQQADRVSPFGYLEVGASLPPIVFGPSRGAGDDCPEASGGRVISKRFPVMGHWRNQAHGPGRSERKLIYIEPFMKGPEMAEAVNRSYLAVDAEREMPSDDWERRP